MLGIERRSEILRLVRRDGSVKVGELSALFEVTEETIRRDITKLDQEGQVKKTYGGAVLLDSLSEDVSYVDRERSNIMEKRRIAQLAQQFIDHGDTIFIDASTTALEMAKAIDRKKEVTIITNSVLAINQLTHYENIHVIGIGGTLNPKNLSMEGPVAIQCIDYYNADKLFFSVKGITKEKGLMDSKEVSVEIKKHMMENSKQVFLLADTTKFGQSALFGYLPMHHVDALITDYEMDKSWKAYFEKNEVEIIS